MLKNSIEIMGLTIFMIIFLAFSPIIVMTIVEKLQNREIKKNKKEILPNEISNILNLINMSKSNYNQVGGII